ncbi:MAG TPA: hypothetical protein VFV57_04610 [Limnobacter sp.]|nr:hypothetical protein [Limnobacter sp.]
MRIRVQLCTIPIALSMVMASAPAHAHLTWIEMGESVVGLATGHHYPSKELTVTGEYVSEIACEWMQRTEKLKFDAQSIRFRTNTKPLNCAAQLKTTQIELGENAALTHLRETKAPSQFIEKVKNTKRFVEIYFKTAQFRPITIGSSLYREEIAQFVQTPNAKDDLRLYRNGKPIVGQPVGLDIPNSPITLWTHTDDLGRVQFPVKITSESLLHTLVIEDQGEIFASQFVTLIASPAAR